MRAVRGSAIPLIIRERYGAGCSGRLHWHTIVCTRTARQPRASSSPWAKPFIPPAWARLRKSLAAIRPSPPLDASRKPGASANSSAPGRSSAPPQSHPSSRLDFSQTSIHPEIRSRRGISPLRDGKKRCPSGRNDRFWVVDDVGNAPQDDRALRRLNSIKIVSSEKVLLTSRPSAQFPVIPNGVREVRNLSVCRED